jgi:hypothetical protein
MQTRSFYLWATPDEQAVGEILDTLLAIEGVSGAIGDYDSKNFVVQWSSPATWQDFESTLSKIGYRPANIDLLSTPEL